MCSVTIRRSDDGVVDAAIDAALAARARLVPHALVGAGGDLAARGELAAGKYRDELVAATMLGQSKTFHQAEIDAACEFADFMRYNTHLAQQIYADQPPSLAGEINILDQQALEGFVLALTPFNFTAIGVNLPTMPALMGNTVVWKPSEKAALSSRGAACGSSRRPACRRA